MLFRSIAAEGGRSSIEGAELYNLAEDIGEKNNLAAREPAKVRELAAAWNAWNAGNVEPLWVSSREGKKATKAKRKARD